GDPGADLTTGRLEALLWAVLLGFAVLGAAARAPALGQGAVPHVGSTVLIACLLVLCTEGIVQLVGAARSASERQRGNRVLRQVDQRLDREERPDRDYQRARDRSLDEPLRRRRSA